MTRLRLIFAGTPAFARPSLAALWQAGHEILLVVTQPDRPRGRGRRLAPPDVKIAADALALPVLQPERIDNPETERLITGLAPDAVIVVAFGQKIPPWLLNLPRLGCLNVHASLLPKYRGASPIQRALMAGETRTGVCVMRLDEGWDTGPVYTRRVMAIGPDENAGELQDRLAEAGAGLLVETLAAITETGLTPVPQDGAQATTAPKLRPEEARLSWREAAQRLHNLVRALAPVPLAETFHAGRRLQIARTAAEASDAKAPPGTVLEIGRGILVRCGDGALRLLLVKPEGGRLMPAEAYARGRRLLPGVRLG
ncbi:MAG: methionyl-tRNA formyltransferase [Patescibacteria group bacterium]